MRFLQGSSENVWDRVPYELLDEDGLLPRLQEVACDEEHGQQGSVRENKFVCKKCVKELCEGAAKFAKIDERDRALLFVVPQVMQGAS